MAEAIRAAFPWICIAIAVAVACVILVKRFKK